MRRSKRLRHLIFVAGLLGIVAIGTTLLPQEPLLLDRAVKVVDVPGWWSPESTACDYRWVSDTVLFTGTGEWRLNNPILYDILSHRQTPLTLLQKHLQKENDMGTNDWELSPDGKWLLWTMELYSDVRAARLDGSGFQIVALPPPGNTVGLIGWEEDSHHWRAEGFDYSSGKLTNVFGGDVSLPGKGHSLPLSAGEAFFHSDSVRVDKDSNCIVVRLPEAGYVADSKGKSVTLRPPRDRKIIDIVQSNEGNQLAWLLVSVRTPLMAKWLRLLYPRYAVPPHTYIEMWLSRLDGSDMREVGYIVAEGDADEAEQPDNLRWLPSDKKISFLYKEALWTVAAE